MIRVNMAKLESNVALRLVLFASLAAATQHKCADVNPKACELMAQSNPNLCSDNTLAEAACPRFCNICPIECYHCDTTLTDIRGCNSTKLCAQSQVCMQKVMTSSADGHRVYQLSCERKELCDGGGLTLAFGKRGLEVRDVSITCCHDDRCNYPVTTANSTTHASGSSCIDIIGPEQCRFLISSFAVCSNLTVAKNSGCLASCGYCGHSVSPSTSTSTPTTVRTITTAAARCKKDVIVIVEAEDASHVSGVDVEQFISALASQLPIGPDAVLISLSEYDDDNHHTVWGLSSYPSNTSLKNAIYNLHRRFSDRALGISSNSFILAQKSALDNRQDAPDVLVTLTDDNNGGLDSLSVFQAYAGQFEQVLAVGVDHHFGDDHNHMTSGGRITSQGTQFVVINHHMIVSLVSAIAARICPPPAV